MPDTDPPLEPRSGSFWRTPWPWAVIAGLIFIPAVRPFLRNVPDPPAVIGQVPAFSLVDSAGRTFGNAEMEGEVWVANFIFTRCASICPLLTASMARLDDRYRENGIEDVKLISVTVDPEYDTPEILRAYGAEHGIDPDRWTLLTGPPEAVHDLVVGGFKTVMGDRVESEAGLIDIAHTGRFALIDRNGGIRGYYGVDEDGLDELFHRSRHVMAE